MIDVDLIDVLLGGGGAVTVITAVRQWYKDRANSKKVREDTALERSKNDYRELKEEHRRAKIHLWWYQDTYPLLREAYIKYAQDDDPTFPPVPPPDII